jgi:hypothetical protein
MPTLTADPGTFTLSGKPIGPRLVATTGRLALAGQIANLGRSFEVAMPLTLLLTRLRITDVIARPDGTPTPQFHLKMQKRDEAIEAAFSGLAQQVAAIQAAYDAAAQATAAASAANNAVTAVEDLATTVQSTVTQIEDGTYNFSKLTVGGQQFGNVGGEFAALV